MDEKLLVQFLEYRAPEGPYLDYKENFSSGSDREVKREFLKDITAFANAHGGNLFIGTKEPDENLTAQDQLIGLDQQKMHSADLERLASMCVDPRIPGLIIRDIPLTNGKYCIAVHIPASISRPHMVDYKGHKSFYIRHSESSVHMTTHEIRDSVISSVSAEDRVKQYLKSREIEEIKYFGREKEPLLLLEAVPLIAPLVSWAMDDKLANVLIGTSRRGKYESYASLCSDVAPRPTIDGIIGSDSRDDTTWKTEVHRNGYISATIRHMQKDVVDDVERYILTKDYCQFFGAFCDLINEVWIAEDADVPYILSCKYLSAKDTILWTDYNYRIKPKPYEKDNIYWPLHYRNPGENASRFAEDLCLELFNAFGHKTIK